MLCTAFHSEDHYCIYSAWSNQTARVPERLYRLFSESSQNGEIEQKCRELGLLPGGGIPLRIFREERIQEGLADLDSMGPENLVLTMTEQCNFRCRYCQFSGAYHNSRSHSATRMTGETALRAVEWCAGFDRGKRHIGFYGGEPLLVFASMRQVHEFLNANPEMLSQKIINVSGLKQDPSDVLEAIGVPEEDAAIDHDWIWKIFLESCVKGEGPHDLTRSICEPSMSRLHSWIFLG